jgi:hypothetical protein
MSKLAYLLKRKQSIAAWSDRWQAEAARFADGHRDLLPRMKRLSSAYGIALRELCKTCYVTWTALSAPPKNL